MRLRFRRTLEFTFTVLLVCIAPAAVLLPGILHGDVALSTQSVFAFTPWEEARPPEVTPPANPEANLMAQQYYPWYVFLSQVDEPRDILWNPLENAGLPFLALWRTRCLSPFTLPFYFGEPGPALTWSVYLKLLVAGLCAMYAARRLGFHRPVALFVALAFQLSAGMILWWGYPITDVLPWLPLLVLFCERIALGHYRMWASGAVAMGLMLLGGDPQGVAVLMLLAVMFILTRFKLDGRGLKGAVIPLLVLAASGLMSLCLTAIQLLPFAEFMRQARTLGLVPPDSALSLWDLSLIVLPHLHGAFTQALRSGDASAQTAGLLHVGIAQIALLPVWLAMRPFSNARQRHRIEALLLPTAVLTILALLWGPVLRLIPVVDLIAPHHYLAANGFVLALAAAAAAEEWVHLNAQDCQDTLKRLLVFGPLFLLIAAGVVALGVLSPKTAEDVKTLAIIPGILFAVVLAVFAVTTIKPSPRLMGYVLSLVVLVNALATFGAALPFTKIEQVYPETDFIRLLRGSGSRVSGSDALERWPLQANLVPQIYGCSGAMLHRQADFRSRVEGDPLLLRRVGSAMLLLTHDDVQGKFAAIRPVLRVEQVLPSGAVLFFDAESKARVRIAYQGVPMERYDPMLLTSESAALLEDAIPPGGDAEESGTAVIDPSSTNTRIAVHVSTEKKGVLLLADAWYPGWTATVDGAPARVFPADLMFRGVEVPAGAKRVEFVYDPFSVRLGLYISLAGLVVVSAGLLALLPAAIKRLRHQRKWNVPT